jgi:hypothetical protein
MPGGCLRPRILPHQRDAHPGGGDHGPSGGGFKGV